jgi:hypothetical protein
MAAPPASLPSACCAKVDGASIVTKTVKVIMMPRILLEVLDFNK